MIFLGIDPGMTGCCVAIDGHGVMVSVLDTPTVGRDYDLPALVTVLRPLCPVTWCVIEHQRAFGRAGRKSSFKIGLGYGIWLGALVALRIPHEALSPYDWRREIGIQPPDLDGVPEFERRKVWRTHCKTRALELAEELHPNLDLRRGPRCKPSHDRAEALLLARVARDCWIRWLDPAGVVGP